MPKSAYGSSSVRDIAHNMDDGVSAFGVMYLQTVEIVDNRTFYIQFISLVLSLMNKLKPSLAQRYTV